jgi:hypothetical protein
LYRVKKHNRRVWMVRVYVADTGRFLSEFRCPYQEPTYRHIQLRTLDSTGDGTVDTVVLRAQRGRRWVSRSYLVA